jgi:hypothetical protein
LTTPVAQQAVERLPEAVGKGLVVLPTGALRLDQLKAVFAMLLEYES